MSSNESLVQRRELLRLAGLSPFALAGCAQITTAQSEEISEVCDSSKEATKDNVSTVKLKKVASVMWAQFLSGVGGKGIEAGVFQKGFEMSSGPVIKNLHEFDDATGKHPDTEKCCKTCGEKAAAIAGAGKISPVHFEQAWCDTQVEMAQLLNRARSIAIARGETPKPAGGGAGC